MLDQNRSISDDFLDIARFPPQSVDLLMIYLTSGDVLGLIGFGPPSSSDQPSRSPKLFPKKQNLLFLSRTTSKHALLTAGNVSGRFTRSPKADIQNPTDLEWVMRRYQGYLCSSSEIESHVRTKETIMSTIRSRDPPSCSQRGSLAGHRNFGCT